MVGVRETLRGRRSAWRLSPAGTLSVVLLSAIFVAPAFAQPLYFVTGGSLSEFRPEQAAQQKADSFQAVPTELPVHEFLGLTSDGKPLVSLGTPFLLDGMISDSGVQIALLSPSGGVEKVIHENAVRAYPAPVGDAIALIHLDYTISLYRGDGSIEPVPVPGRTVLAAWSPDGGRLCLTAYPPDWSPHRMHNPDGPDDFLRLINNDLYLYDPGSGKITQLTHEPGYDYSGVFSPDGQRILFISDRSGRGAFYVYDLTRGETTQLTNRAPGSYEVPIGRSDTIRWLARNDTIVYEAQEGSDVHAIRSLRGDGSSPRRLAYGRQPRVFDGGRKVAFLSPEGRVQTADLE